MLLTVDLTNLRFINLFLNIVLYTTGYAIRAALSSLISERQRMTALSVKKVPQTEINWIIIKGAKNSARSVHKLYKRDITIAFPMPNKIAVNATLKMINS